MHRAVIWLTTLLLLCSARAGADAIQDVDGLRAVATALLIVQTGRPAQDVSVEVGAPDPRLQLAACAETPEAFMPPGARGIGNTTVGVRCGSPQPWTVYLSARVSAFAEVVVSTRPLRRGAKVTAADVQLIRRDLAGLPYGYLEQLDRAIGRELTRSAGNGVVLSPNQLMAPNIVERGSRVIVLARTAGMEVRMNGEALANAAAGERVKVRTDNGGRTVEGTVISPGVVQITL